MADSRISVHDRVAAIDHLEAAALDLNQVAAWLGQAGCEPEADTVNDAAKSLLAACWWLNRPLSPGLPPQRGSSPAWDVASPTSRPLTSSDLRNRRA